MLWIKINELFSSVFLGGYESPFSQEEITPVLNTFLKKAEKQSFKGVVKGASLKVYVSGKHIIGMDYSLPVMEYGKPSELLKIPDRIQYSGSQSVSEVEDVPDFYFRVQEGLVVPFYMDGVAACGEGVGDLNESLGGVNLIIHNRFRLSSGWQLAETILRDTKVWGELDVIFKNNKNTDIYIYPAGSKVSWGSGQQESIYFDGDGYISTSKISTGSTFYVENKASFDIYCENNQYNTHAILLSDVEEVFNHGRKLILLMIRVSIFELIENKYLSFYIKNNQQNGLTSFILSSQETQEDLTLKNNLTDICGIIIHELWAHARPILIGQDKPEEMEHLEYFREYKHESPKIQDIETQKRYENTLAKLHLNQIRKSVYAHYPFHS